LRRGLWIGIVLGLGGCHEPGSSDALDTDDPTGSKDGPTTGTDTGHPPNTGPNTHTTGDAEMCALLYGGLDRVRGPDEGLPVGVDGRTLQIWVRTNLDRGEQVALSYGRPSAGQGFQVGVKDGYAMARSGDSDLYNLAVGDIFLADDEWHHLAAAWDGRIVVVTVDGQTAAVQEIDLDSIEGDLVAGNTPTGDLTKPWIGWLDDAKIFDGPRSPTDIHQDPDGVELPSESLLLWWDFEIPEDQSGPGVTIPDLSGNGHDGITGGGTDSPEFPRCR
jgi:hypothetical protein